MSSDIEAVIRSKNTSEINNLDVDITQMVTMPMHYWEWKITVRHYIIIVILIGKHKNKW